MSVPFRIYAYIKKNYVHTMHSIPWLPSCSNRSQRIVILKCPLQSCFAGRGKGESKLCCKENGPTPFEESVSFPHYGAPGPSHPSLGILVEICAPKLVPSLFPPFHAHLSAPSPLALPLPGVKWGEFQSGVNVYSLLETLKNKNSS